MFIRKCLLCMISLWLLSVYKDADALPFKKDRNYYEKKGQVIWEVPTDQKLIALTFDDGPDIVQTNAILDLLGEYDARGTFFVIGNRVVRYPEVAQRIVTEGHEVANHTYNHTFFKPPSSPEKVRQEIERTEDEIYKATGRRSSLFRPPGGIYDDTIVQISNRMGLVPVIWSWHQDTKDWRKPGVTKILDRVLRNARNGDIVLFHDHVRGKSQTIAALERLLPELRARGYRLVTVSELIRSSIWKAHHKQQDTNRSNPA